MKVYNLENIKSATELKHWTEVISMNERSIIVLDTFTGIAQKLQAVSISLFHLDIEKVMNQLQDFENDCGNWLDNLLSSEIQKAEAAKEIKVHIDQISRLCNENLNIIDDHEIMAHGAMISSLILSHYLEECTKKNFILNSCHFMRLGFDRKPDIKYVKKNVEELMKACPDVPILITQSRLCKNVYDEVDFFPQIGNELCRYCAIPFKDFYFTPASVFPAFGDAELQGHRTAGPVPERYWRSVFYTGLLRPKWSIRKGEFRESAFCHSIWLYYSILQKKTFSGKQEISRMIFWLTNNRKRTTNRLTLCAHQ